MSGVRKSVLAFVLLNMVLLSACSAPVDQGRPTNAHTPDLKNSFSLRQGRFSAVTCLARDKKGYIYAAGFSDENFVLLKLDSELKTLVKMVRFGSSGGGGGKFSPDTIKDIAIDSNGNVFVVGYTRHSDFPTTQGCYDQVFTSKRGVEADEGFITKFSAELKVLASTLVGGDWRDRIYGIAIDKDNDVYVSGYCEGASPKYQENLVFATGGYDHNPPAHYQRKAFVARFSNDLKTLKSGTFLGGNNPGGKSNDCAYAIALDNDGHVWVAGQTGAVDFPLTRGSYGRNLAGESDAFVAKFDSELKRLLASTYIGGRKDERANAIVVDPKGSVFVGGWSDSADMLVFLSGYNTKYSGNEEDAFIVKMDNDLKEIESATFLGGNRPAQLKGEKARVQGDDKLTCLLLADDGQTLYAAGRTESRDFNTTPPSLKQHYGNTVLNVMFDRSSGLGERTDQDYGDGFIVRLDTRLSTCISSSLLGGTSLDYIDDILLQGGDLYVAGETRSEDFPGMLINYGINATRGYISRLNKNLSRKFSAQKPMPLELQFTETEIRKIADTLSKNVLKDIFKEEIYANLGSYAKDHISREMFEAKLDRALFLYGKPFKLGMQYHHYNYFQDDLDGYDVIEICYVLKSIPNAYYPYTNPYSGRIVLTIMAKKKKWQLVDVQYRKFSSETSRKNMQKRLY